jgi:branched-chain amino acid transport system permease protein
MPTSLDDLLFAYQNLIFAIGINGLLGLSMYAVLSTGQLSLGQAAFMGIGAYVAALLALNLDLPLALLLLAAMVAPAAAALLIGGPTLKLSGVYLALATIAFGEVLRIVAINTPVTGGALGLSGIPPRVGFVTIYGALGLALAGFTLVARSRWGRAMEAMREDEVAAGLMGIDLPRLKLASLVVSAMLAGLAGAMNALSTSFIGPNDYGFDQAVTILSYALLGGIGSAFGPVLGAGILTALPEILRPLHDYRMVLNGLIIVAAVLFMPRGLLPWRIRRHS